MTKSMTAFARIVTSNDELEVSWQLKSVNQRYLDLNLRLPDELGELEMKIRETVQQGLSRGKLEATCRYRRLSQAESGVAVNSERVAAVIQACNEIEMQMGVGQTLNSLDILNFPGIIEEERVMPKNSANMILQGLSDCINELQQNRLREGERMAELILQRASKISQIVGEVRERRPAVVEAVQNKLRQKVAELSEKVNSDRLEQELVIIAHKMDVDEELDRLDSHLEELHHIFKRDEPIGRRLDFLMQEFNREANTLGSKSADTETTQAAIELKVLIEQMREQVQNIE